MDTAKGSHKIPGVVERKGVEQITDEEGGQRLPSTDIQQAANRLKKLHLSLLNPSQVRRTPSGEVYCYTF